MGLGLPAGHVAGGLGPAPVSGGGLGAPGASGSYSTWGKVLGFAGSALESFPEMFGITPSTATQAFRAEHPILGFGSEMVGLAVPYGAAAKGVSMVPRLNAIVQGAPKFFGLVERPIASIAAKWATEAALLETARVGIAATPLPSMVFGKPREEGLGTLAGEGALNVAGAFVLGGGVGAVLNRAARGPSIAQLVPEASPQQPLVQRIRGLNDAIEAGGQRAPDGTVARPWTEEELVDLKYQRETLKRANFADIEPAYTPTGHARVEPELGARYNYKDGVKVVRPLENDPPVTSGKTYTEALNTWMNPNKVNVGRQGEARLLMVDPERGFASQGELDDVLTRIGLPKDDLALLGQNHRILRVNEGTGDPVKLQNAAQELENLMTGRRPGTIRSGNPMQRVADDWFVAREEENGMWVTAKKVRGEVGKAKPGDEWFVMRTDTPDVLDPQAVKFRETTVNRSAYWPERVQSNIGVGAFDLANQFERELGPMQFIPKGLRPTASNLAAAGAQVAKDMLAYVTPLVGLMGRNNRANYIGNLVKTMTDRENAIVKGTLYGNAIIEDSKPVIGQVLGLKEPKTGGLADFFKTLDEADWTDVQTTLELQIPYEQLRELAAAGHVTPKAFEALSRLETISRSNVADFTKLKEIVGASSAQTLIEDFSARAGHYGMTRVRDGGFYAYLDDPRTGELKGIVAGNTAKEARDKAYALIVKRAKLGQELQYAGMQDDILRDGARLYQFKTSIRKPGFLKERGVLIGDELMNGPLNAEKFTQMVERNLKARERFKTNVVLQEKLWYPMMRLRNEDPTIWKQMLKRVGGIDEKGNFVNGILMGDEGAFAEATNRAVDKVLGHVLGKDSASTIVRVTQETLNAFQFGFGNLSHYALNATSMFMTTFPQAAFVMRTAGTDLSNYITVPARDEGGRIVDSVNVLSDVKLFTNSLRRALGKNNEPGWLDLVRQMQDEGVLSPVYAEQHIGAAGEIVRDLKGAFENGKSFVRWARHVNELLLAKSEEFNRLVGVATAYEGGKLLGIVDNPVRLSRFTREFLSKTAYNYSTVDRPTIFTTPVGSLMGTFKTWMFHYMVNMAEYAGGGRQTFAPLMWQTAATAAIGGVTAVPLLKPIADGASKWFTDKNFMQNVYGGLFGDDETIPDGIMYGLPGVLGLSLAAQASSPGADPMRDASMIFNFAIFDRMGTLGKAIGGAWEAHKATGVSPFEDDQTRDRLIRALAPRTVYRAMSVSEDHAIRSLNTGYRVMDNVSMGDAMLYSMGFNPVDLDKNYTAYHEIRKDQARMKAAVGELGRQLADAWEGGDNVLASRVFVSAMAQGFDTSKVLRSAKARMERGQETQLEFTLGRDKAGLGEGWEFATDGE